MHKTLRMSPAMAAGVADKLHDMEWIVGLIDAREPPTRKTWALQEEDCRLAMPTLFMLMGLPGSGKTTVARRLERERRAVLLSPDVWMARIVGDGYDAESRQAVKTVQLDLADRLLRVGLDVILEFGFFARSERDAVRERAKLAGAEARGLPRSAL